MAKNELEKQTKDDEDEVKTGKFMQFWKKLKSIKHIQFIIAIVLIVIALLLYFTISDNKSAKTDKTDDTAVQTSLELQVQTILSTIDGVGKSSVLITYKGTDRQVIAMEEESVTTTVSDSEVNSNRVTSETVTNKTPVMITVNGVEEPVVLQTVRAEIEGVVIVAEGGSDIKTKMNILDAVCTLLNVQSSKIKIYKMNNK